jgi:two-component system NarL family sensor kinase
MSYRTKLLFLTLIPIMLITLATLWVLDARSSQLVNAQRQTIHAVILEEKKQELRNYLSLAQKAIDPSYNSFLKTKRQAQSEAKEILREMSANEDQYFYVYDGDGNAIVDPRHSFMQGKNWIGLVNKDGIPVIKNLIQGAKAEQEFYTFVWQKPSTKEYVPKLNHAKYFERWNWVLATGIYLDDVDREIAAINTEMQDGFTKTKRDIAILAIGALTATALVMWIFQFTQQRLADAELRRLNTRLVDIQESNRKRISQELHDGISQLLVSSRYSLEAALGNAKPTTKSAKATSSAMNTMDAAIAEVRRISLFLRPTVLDDVGLAAAVRALGKDFERDLGIKINVEAMPIRDLLPDDAKTAMYRIVQEALTNITKYANASHVTIKLETTRRRVVLEITDDGVGFDTKRKAKGQGLGLRNMRERIDSFGGQITINSKPNSGTQIKVALPIQRIIGENT